MELGMIQFLKMKQSVERILHVPGNYKGGILEMALVVDCNMDKTTAKEGIAAIVKALKSHSETFRNVRLNVVWWKSDEEIVTDNTMNLHLLSLNHALRTYFDFTKIWANKLPLKCLFRSSNSNENRKRHFKPTCLTL